MYILDKITLKSKAILKITDSFKGKKIYTHATAIKTKTTTARKFLKILLIIALYLLS